jgi:hypothetical protein
MIMIQEAVQGFSQKVKSTNSSDSLNLIWMMMMLMMMMMMKVPVFSSASNVFEPLFLIPVTMHQKDQGYTTEALVSKGSTHECNECQASEAPVSGFTDVFVFILSSTRESLLSFLLKDRNFCPQN